MKSWYMHQFTTVFSNDFQICSLIFAFQWPETLKSPIVVEGNLDLYLPWCVGVQVVSTWKAWRVWRFRWCPAVHSAFSIWRPTAGARLSGRAYPFSTVYTQVHKSIFLIKYDTMLYYFFSGCIFDDHLLQKFSPQLNQNLVKSIQVAFNEWRWHPHFQYSIEKRNNKKRT